MKIKKVKISDSLKNVTKISSGTIAGQLISIVTLPIITRIYGAEVMGIWATIMAVSIIVQGICDLGITSSIMIEEQEEKVNTLYSVITTISLLICVFAGVLAFPYFMYIKQYELKNAIFYCFLVTGYAFSVKQVNTCYTWLNRYKEYNTLMLNPVVNYSTVAFIAIGLGCLGYTKYGYYFAVMFGQMFTVVNMKRKMPRKTFCSEFTAYKYAVRKYNDLIRYQLPNNFVIQIRDQIPTIIIGSLFGDKILGYYSVSGKLLRMPVTFIGQAVGKVFYQTISEMKRKGQEIGEYVSRNMNRAINLAFIPVFGLFAVGDIVAYFFFGSEYIMAGSILRIVVFQTFFIFVTACTQGLEIVLRKQKYSLIATTIQTICSTLGLVIGYYATHSIYVAIALNVITYIVIQVALYNKLFKFMGHSMREHIKKMILFLVAIILLSIIIRIGVYFVRDAFGIEALEWFKIGL